MNKNIKNIIFSAAIIFVAQFGFSQNFNPNGFNIFYFENDSVSSKGFLKNGKPNGYWINYEKNGNKKSEGNRKNFLLDSTWKFYENNFIKEQVNYSKNSRNGLFLEFGDSASFKVASIPLIFRRAGVKLLLMILLAADSPSAAIRFLSASLFSLSRRNW